MRLDEVARKLFVYKKKLSFHSIVKKNYLDIFIIKKKRFNLPIDFYS